MKCRFDEKILSQFTDNALPARMSVLVREHIPACPVCGRKIKELGRINGVFRAVPSIVESEYFDQLMMP